MTHRFIRYGIAGSVALAVHLAILAVLVDALAWDETIASAIGFTCAVPVNYYLQRRFVFNSATAIGRSFAIYCVVTLSMLGINTGVFWVLVTQLGLYYLAAQTVTTCAVVMLNYIANRTVTFPEPAR